MNRNRVLVIILIATISFVGGFISCSDHKNKESNAVERSESRSLDAVKSSNVRKTASISLVSDDLDAGKRSIVALTDENRAQILSEWINVGSDDSTILRYEIKVPAESFAALLDQLVLLGRLKSLNIEAVDVSDDLATQVDRIDLLTTRLQDAIKAKNSTLADELKEKLKDAKLAKQNLKNNVIYSYIRLTLTETTKLSQALALGVHYGREGFVWMAKFAVILLISSAPMMLLYILVRLTIAFLKYPWRKFLDFLERLGEWKEKENE